MIRRVPLTARALLAALPCALDAQELVPVYRELGSLGEGGVSAPVESPRGRYIVYRGIARPGGETYELRIYDRATARWSAFGPAGVDNAWALGGDRLASARLEERERELYVWTVPFDARSGRPSGPPRRVSVRPGRAPAFSPDGRWIAFSTIPPSDTAAPRIVVIPSAGGPERVLLTRPGWVQMLRWSPDGRWLYYRYHARIPSSAPPSLERVPATGGESETLRTVRDFIGISRDGRYLAYLPADGPMPAAGTVVGISTSEGPEIGRFVLRPGLELGGWSAEGERLLATRRRVAGAIRAVAPTGAPVRTLAADSTPSLAPSWNPAGDRIAFIRAGDAGTRLVVASATGEEREEIATRHSPHPMMSLAWSPDGRWLAYFAATPGDGNGAGGPSLNAVDLSTGEERTLAREPVAGSVVWRRDGQALRYVRASVASAEVREVSLDGQGETLRALDGELGGGTVTLVGDSAAVVTSPRGVFALSLETGAVRRIYVPDTAELEPRWFHAGVTVSSDGRWGALLVLDRSRGGGEAGVRLLPLSGGASRVVPVGWMTYRSGFVWHPDGQHLVVLGHRRNARRAEMWLIPTDGARPRPLTTGEDGIEFLSGPAIAPDGGAIAYSVVTSVTSTLWEVDLAASLNGLLRRGRR